MFCIVDNMFYHVFIMYKLEIWCLIPFWNQCSPLQGLPDSPPVPRRDYLCFPPRPGAPLFGAPQVAAPQLKTIVLYMFWWCLMICLIADDFFNDVWLFLLNTFVVSCHHVSGHYGFWNWLKSHAIRDLPTVCALDFWPWQFCSSLLFFSYVLFLGQNPKDDMMLWGPAFLPTATSFLVGFRPVRAPCPPVLLNKHKIHQHSP